MAIDLFAGAGGMSLGFEQAGFRVAAAVEIDPIHAAVHAYNFPGTVVIPRSAALLSGGEIRARAGIGDTPVDCVFGGPPCQGFSMMGQRALDDPRNGLVREFVRLVVELGARRFVFENVKGLAQGKHRAFLEELVSTFRASGYEVQLPWRLVDAADLGVPQRRERVILMGGRDGVPDYPEPLASQPPGQGRAGTVSSGEALADIPDCERFEALWTSDRVRASLGVPSAYAAMLRDDPLRDWDDRWLSNGGRSRHTAVSRARFRDTPQGAVEPVSRFFKLHPDRPCNTLRAGTDGGRGAFTSPRPIHYAFDRCVTVREMARLHGYPDWFRFHVTTWHGAREVGNSVPPPMARAIAREVARSLGYTPGLLRRVPLGDPALLEFDRLGAARFFDVEPLAWKRASLSPLVTAPTRG